MIIINIMHRQIRIIKLSFVQHYKFFLKWKKEQVVYLTIPSPTSGPAISHVTEQSTIPWISSIAVLSSDGGLFFEPVILSIRKICPSRVTTSWLSAAYPAVCAISV